MTTMRLPPPLPPPTPAPCTSEMLVSAPSSIRAIALLATVSVIGAVLFYWYRSRNHPRRDDATTAESDGSSSPPKLDSLFQRLDALASPLEASPADFLAICEHVQGMALSNDVNIGDRDRDWTARRRHKAASIIHTMCMSAVAQCAVDAPSTVVKEAVGTSWPRLHLALYLLSCAECDSDVTTHCLRLNVARTVKDTSEMIVMIKAMMARKEILTVDEMMSVISAAPLVGRWSEFLDLLSRFDSSERMLQQVHAAAIKTSTTPTIDLFVLYEQLQRGVVAPLVTPDHTSLLFEALSVSLLKLKFVSVTYPPGSQAVSADWVKSFPDDWTAVHLVSTRQKHILRVGAVGYWQSPGAIEMPLTGCWPLVDSSSLNLLGFVHMCTKNGAVFISEQSFRLRRDGSAARPHRWTGTHTVTQSPIDASVPAHLIHCLTFDVEMDLVPDANSRFNVLLVS